MNLFKKYLKEIGFFPDKDTEPDDPAEYTPSGASEIIIKEHRDFLRTVLEDEDRRLNTIESKTGQLIGQIGLVFSLLGLFIPILIDRISSINLWIKISLLALLILSFLSYLLTVINAVKNFNVKNFKYSRPIPRNVIDFQNRTLNDFLTEEVNDLLKSNARNVHTNNKKADNLMHAYNSFRIANTLTAFLVISVCIIMMFCKKHNDTLSIRQPVRIENFESSLRMLRDDLKGHNNHILWKTLGDFTP